MLISYLDCSVKIQMCGTLGVNAAKNTSLLTLIPLCLNQGRVFVILQQVEQHTSIE